MALRIRRPLKYRLDELRLRSYRGFEDARITFEDLTVLVGRNGSGKTTVAEALEFLRDALTDSLANALARRGGLKGVRKRTNKGKPFDLSLSIRIKAGKLLTSYGFRVGASGGSFAIKEEHLVSTPRSEVQSSFHRLSDDVESSLEDFDPIVESTSLLLPLVAGQVPEWKKALSFFKGIRAYSLSPSRIGGEPEIGDHTWLDRDGGNAGDVLKRLDGRKDAIPWIVRHVNKITPGIEEILTEDTDTGRRILYFRQRSGRQGSQLFSAAHMSDGTLRALGVLLALRQHPSPSLVFIDELEDSIHPAGLAVLLDAIAVSLPKLQVVITSHSPEALSHEAVTTKRVRILEWRNGASQVFELAPTVDELLEPPETVGSLLRSNALWPDDEPCTVGNDGFFGV